jgi:hypothetical protein
VAWTVEGSTGSVRLMTKSTGCVLMSRCRPGCSDHGKTYQLAVRKGVLLRRIVNGYPAVDPRSDMFGNYCRTVVVIACIGGVDPRIRLRRQRTYYVRQRIVNRPCRAIIGGLARPHSVARNLRVTARATGALPRVIPGGQSVGIATELLGCHWGRAVTSVFNFNGTLKVTPRSVERM